MADELGAVGWCVVDLETTGLFPAGHDRIVEIACVVTEPDGTAEREWHSLVNPGRDLGPTSIHGITADLAIQAPTFADLAGDILDFASGRRLVAHNASFERRFLMAEFERAGIVFEDLDALCTMQMASRLGLGRALADCCASAGIDNAAPHMALGDAKATAELLAYFLHVRDREKGWPEQVRIPSPLVVGVELRPSGRALTREAASEAAVPASYLSRIVGRLPTPSTPSGASAEAVASYAELLDRVLEDRIVTDAELADLVSLAEELGLSHKQVEDINRSYLQGLVSIALADGVVTSAERHDLDRAAALLGISGKVRILSPVRELLCMFGWLPPPNIQKATPIRERRVRQFPFYPRAYDFSDGK